MLREFEIIQKYFLPLAGHHPTNIQIVVNQGDDCAVIQHSQALAFSIDTQIEKRHFLRSMAAADIAWRGLACALSDLAAMGAEPAFFTLALSLTGRENEQWLEDYAAGLAELAGQYRIPLLGGDTTRAEELIHTFQVHGTVERPLTRTGAKPGDLIVISNTLGLGVAGLDAYLHQGPAELQKYYLRPEPQIALGRFIRGTATAAIDISDGLLADLGHLLSQSGVGAEIRLDDFHFDPIYQQWVTHSEQQLEWALTGGDDYQLCFTWPEQHRALLQQAPVPVQVIGQVRDDTNGIHCFIDGREIHYSSTGYQHF